MIASDERKKVSFEVLANNLRKRRNEEEILIEQEITLSPAEVQGEMSETEMRQAAETFLRNGYENLISNVKARGLGNIFMIKGGKDVRDTEVRVTVRISNVLGGK